MPDPASVPRGPKPFEDLLKSVGLSEREADAVRTVVLDLTAAEAAPPLSVLADQPLAAIDNAPTRSLALPLSLSSLDFLRALLGGRV